MKAKKGFVFVLHVSIFVYKAATKSAAKATL
jgi:hypothetical protein